MRLHISAETMKFLVPGIWRGKQTVNYELCISVLYTLRYFTSMRKTGWKQLPSFSFVRWCSSYLVHLLYVAATRYIYFWIFLGWIQSSFAVTIGDPSEDAHSIQLPSKTLILSLSLPHSSRAKAITQAVTPDPHVVIISFSEWTFIPAS